MEMRAIEDTEIGRDLTTQIPPIAYSLSHSYLHSHCSSCFRPLPQPPTTTTTHPLHYCSLPCHLNDHPRHLSSAEHHLFLLLQSPLTTTTWSGETSDLRTALRLLHFFDQLGLRVRSGGRTGGLMSNREKLVEDEEIAWRVKEGGRLMALARRMRDGGCGVVDAVVEETVLCQVLTNAVEVQVNEQHSIGAAVYATRFSWINHSCQPNACYRISVVGSEGLRVSDGVSTLRIRPFGDQEILRTEGQLKDEFCGYGPRLVVRSIKPIKRGEEVCIAYTDLLQPTAIRQSELWSSYRFICCCRRCSALPPTYVDYVLHGNVNNNIDEAYLSIDETISEYLSIGNPESCSEKLENMLICRKEQLQPEEQSSSSYKLNILHYLSLTAYITLASTYKIRASTEIAPNSVLTADWLEGLELSRTSVAYSLLVAGVVHHLFLFEPSLIVTTADFWINAGKSLLSLTQRLICNSTICPSSSDSCLSSLPCYRYGMCSFLKKLEADIVCDQSQSISTELELEAISQGFINCASRISSKIWPFLIQGKPYFTEIKDPVDLSWLGTTKCNVQEGTRKGCEADDFTDDKKANIFQLGTHCLLYGGYLASICYGRRCYLSCHVIDLLCRNTDTSLM